MSKMCLLSLFLACFLALLRIGSCESSCMNLDVLITQRIGKQGFHRQIQWLVEVLSPPQEDFVKLGCNLTLKLTVTSGMFVNPDEINDLNRLGELKAYIEGRVDVEQAAHDASGHIVYIYLPNNAIEKISVNLPFHLRYQRSQLGGGYGKVRLHKPTLLVNCREHTNKICGRGMKEEAPCTFDSSKTCLWRTVEYKSIIDETELYVPIGDLNDYPLVSVISLLLGCAGCIYVLSIMSKKDT